MFIPVVTGELVGNWHFNNCPYRTSLAVQWLRLQLSMQEVRIWPLPMAPHFSTLAWKIPWTEEPGRLQSMGSLRVRHDWVTSLSLSCIGEGNGNPLQCSCLENPGDGGAWWAAVCGVAQSRTWLKQLSSSSSRGLRSHMPFSQKTKTGNRNMDVRVGL